MNKINWKTNSATPAMDGGPGSGPHPGQMAHHYHEGQQRHHAAERDAHREKAKYADNNDAPESYVHHDAMADYHKRMESFHGEQAHKHRPK